MTTSSDIPKYRQLADELRQQIAQGRLLPGDQLPSMGELAEQHSMDWATARRAVTVLRDEGLVDVVQGRGTYVRSQRRIVRDIAHGLRYEYAHLLDAPGDGKGLFEAMTGTPGDVRVDITYSDTTATADLAEAFGGEERGVKSADPLLCRRYAFYVDGAPHAVVRSYLLRSMVEGTDLLDADNEQPGKGTMRQLHDVGIEVRSVQVYLRGRPPTGEERAALRTDGWVWDMRRVMLAGDVPVEVGDSVAPQDRLSFSVNVDLEERC